MQTINSGGLNMDNLVDEFSLFDVMYGGSDSDDDIICTSCARGRDVYSTFMPRLPNYKTVHKKKVEFMTNLGVAETEVRQRALGRGRAKRRQRVVQSMSTVGSVDSASDSDDRLSGRITMKTELRKPKLKLPILASRSDFPHLNSESQQKEQSSEYQKLCNVPKGDCTSTSESFDPGNFNDMAKFLMDSWQDEITDGQFEDAVVRFASSEDKSQESEDYWIGSRKGHSNENDLSDDSIQRRTEDYFSKFEAEVDKTDLEDFENMSISDVKIKLSNEVSNSNSSNQKKRNDEQGGIWYSSDDVCVSEDTNDLQWNSDASDSTDMSQRTDSLLPRDDSDSNNELNQSESRKQFDFILPGHEITKNSANLSNNATNTCTSVSSSEANSTLSKTDSRFSNLTCTTSEKDESEPSAKWEKIGRRKKMKNKGHDSPDSSKDRKSYNKNNSTTKSNHHSKSSKVWRIEGDSVIELNGLPADCDVSVIQDLIASYGIVRDFEKKVDTNSSSIRFRLDNADACEMVVSCLDDTDLFPDAGSKVSCIVVQ